MADALGAAGSIASFAGLAGQLLHGVQFLYDFFSDVREAPGDIQRIASELQLIDAILGEICKRGCADDPTVNAAAGYCKSWIDGLETLARRSEPSSAKIGANKFWSQMSVAFRKKKFGKYIDGLERAKSMLLHAWLNS